MRVQRKKNLYKYVLLIGIVLAFGLTNPVAVHAAGGNWVQEGSNWKYQNADGSYLQNKFQIINGRKYYFDANGIMQTGWIQVGTRSSADGKQYKNWYYAEPSGALIAGWKVINGTWYYFYMSGRMAADAVVDNGRYYVDGEGVYIGSAGAWKLDSSGWWYQSTDADCYWNKEKGKYLNYPCNDVVLIDGAYYGFNANGYMVTGWHNYGYTSNGRYVDVWYYFASNGKAVDGWQMISGTWYYFEDGYMLADTVVEGYYLDANGAYQPSVTAPSQGTGTWQYTSGGWKYIYANGNYEHTGRKQIDGVWYCFDTNGIMQTGWVKEGDIWYYYNADGSAANGWLVIGGTWYYFDVTGYMYANTFIDGYYVNQDGAWITGGPSYATY